MRKTGSLLRETLEHEADLAAKITQAHADARQAVEEAQLEASLALDASRTEGERYAAESLRYLTAEILSEKDEQKNAAADAILLMEKNFSTHADSLAEAIAGRILRYGS